MIFTGGTGLSDVRSAIFRAEIPGSKVAYYVPNKFPVPGRPEQVVDNERQAGEVLKLVKALTREVGGATVMGAVKGAYYSEKEKAPIFEDTKIVYSYDFDGLTSLRRLLFIELAIDFAKRSNQEEIIVEVGEFAYRILEAAYDEWKSSL